MSANRYLPAAHRIARELPEILGQIGLKPHIHRFVLTETGQGAAWLFVVLDVSLLTGSEKSYTAPDVLQQISTKLSGLPVVMINNINGLCYAILLSPAPMLQKATSGDPSPISGSFRFPQDQA
jgi:hypothetical protein